MGQIEGKEGLKECKTCGELKSSNEYYQYKNKRKDKIYTGQYGVCKKCINNKDRKRLRKHKIENKNTYISPAQEEKYKARDEAKSVPCMDCGIKYPTYVMDFDHRPGEKKVKNVSSMIALTLKEMIEEIKKCDVVCSNCHRERTQQRHLKKIKDKLELIDQQRGVPVVC